MKLKKLTHQFLLNYVLIFFLIISLAYSVYYFYSKYDYWKNDLYAIDTPQFELDYFEGGMNSAVENQHFHPNDYVVVMTTDREVIDTYNAPQQIGYSFGENELQELVFGSNSYDYFVAYSEDRNYLFLYYIKYLDPEYTYIATIVICGIMLFVLLTVAFAKYTSNQILYPILTLVKGVQKITHGDYDVHISFDASNELNVLKDEINVMTDTIKNETERRTKLEENRKQLLRDISHDIRTPLTNIIGYSDQLLRDGTFSSTEQKQNIEIIHQYGNSANQLINELFDLSRLELEDAFLELKDYDIGELLRLKIIDYINEFENHDVDYEIELPETPILIKLNQIKFQRILDNLIQNSLKYNRNDFKLFIGLQIHATYYELTLADNGIGIPEEYHDSIFNPLVRIENSRNRDYGGTGLGLSIVEKIVERHGWSITLAKIGENHYSKGSTFKIAIPK